jgi:hypothetical protein
MVLTMERSCVSVRLQLVTVVLTAGVPSLLVSFDNPKVVEASRAEAA